MKNNYKTNLAFTLAEVLIVIGIIGIVANMTIPTLIANTQKTQYTTSLKKSYSEFNQVLSQITTDYGCTGDLVCTGLFAAGSTTQALGDEFVKYFKVIKSCGIAANAGCFSASVSDNYDGSSARNNTIESANASSYYKFITANGTSYAIWNSASGCTVDSSSGKTNNLKQVCGVLYVDVNGPTKGPNNYGRDIFALFISTGKGPLLYPVGASDTNGNWWDDGTGNAQRCFSGSKSGLYCAGRIVEQGWEMNY